MAVINQNALVGFSLFSTAIENFLLRKDGTCPDTQELHKVFALVQAKQVPKVPQKCLHATGGGFPNT